MKINYFLSLSMFLAGLGFSEAKAANVDIRFDRNMKKSIVVYPNRDQEFFIPSFDKTEICEDSPGALKRQLEDSLGKKISQGDEIVEVVFHQKSYTSATKDDLYCADIIER